MVAYFRKTAKGGWRAEVDCEGKRKSQSFETKAAAVAWAGREESILRAGSQGTFPNHTLSEAFRRYEKEVSKKKRGSRAEGLRFTAFERDFPDLAAKVMHKITTPDLVKWRDTRLEKVSESSVLREGAQLRNVWTFAIEEWHWCGEPSPWKKAKLPPKGHARTRRTKWQEVKLILRHLGYRTGKPPTTPSQEVAYAYLIAQHTAMRAGEIQGLGISTVDLTRRVVRLETHKTVEVEGTRFVPLFKKAVRVLSVLEKAAKKAKRDKYFTVSVQSFDVLFRKARDRLLLKDLHFHDSRADALTRMARKVDVMTLARISGHRDLRQLLRAYYRETAEEIAARL